MITRKALLIANPGEGGAKNYCKGVNKDMENYKSFLLSPLGGQWYPNEIDVMHKPKLSSLKEKIGGDPELVKADVLIKRKEIIGR